MAEGEATPASSAHAPDVAARLASLLGHDLRNPLGTILTGVRALQLRAAPGDADAERLVGAVVRACDLVLAQAMLARDYAQATLAGTVPITRHDADVAALVRQVADAAGMPASRVHGVEAPLPWRCDAPRVAQALGALVREVRAMVGEPVSLRVDADGATVTIVIEGDASSGEAAPRGDESARDAVERLVTRAIVAAHGGDVASDVTGATRRWRVRLPGDAAS
jgi:signal transduction histidine kinase